MRTKSILIEILDCVSLIQRRMGGKVSLTKTRNKWERYLETIPLAAAELYSRYKEEKMENTELYNRLDKLEERGLMPPPSSPKRVTADQSVMADPPPKKRNRTTATDPASDFEPDLPTRAIRDWERAMENKLSALEKKIDSHSERITSSQATGATKSRSVVHQQRDPINKDPTQTGTWAQVVGRRPKEDQRRTRE